MTQPNDPPETDRALLDEVSVQSFTATPSTIAPFSSTTIRWSVTAPQGVTIAMNEFPGPNSGERTFSPTTTSTFHLTAKVGRYTKNIAAVTVHVDLAQCLTLDSNQLPQLLSDQITASINADPTLYFRLTSVPGPLGLGQIVQSTPGVTITLDEIHIGLSLGKRVDYFPDPDIEITTTFALEVVADATSHAGVRSIVAYGRTINVDVSFPWYAWAIPGAAVALPIVIDGIKEKATKNAEQMIATIVGPPGPPLPDAPRNLNTFFVPPAGLEKHDVKLYVDPDGKGIFAVVFCPPAGPVIIHGRAGSLSPS
jgi:hypothetical protein